MDTAFGSLKRRKSKNDEDITESNNLEEIGKTTFEAFQILQIVGLENLKEPEKSARRTSIQIFQDGLDWFDTLKSNKTENSSEVSILQE